MPTERLPQITTRPACFGSGQDPDSGQRVALDDCRRCHHVIACGTLRLARFAERDLDDFARVYLNAKFPHGRPIDRWGRS